MIKIKIIRKILFDLFSNRIQMLKTLNELNNNQLDYIYNYLYKQKVLQHSYNYLKQIPTNRKERLETILLKTIEYEEKTKFRDSLLRERLYFLSCYLTQNKIEHISLKGPLFSEMYFKNSGKRVSGDIDLLIDKRDVLKTKDILVKAGYDVDETLFDKSILYHYHFEAKKDNTIVEIHWNIDYGKNNYWDYLYYNSYFITFNDIKVRVLNDEGQFVLFIVSISKDWFTRASANKYLDLYQIMKQGNLDYNAVFEVIERFNLTNRCYSVLFCLQHFCENKIYLPTKHTDFLTRIFVTCFLTRRKILLCKVPHRIMRQLGEKLIWKDTSFTSVPNIYK